jgi:hypothetical protein
MKENCLPSKCRHIVGCLGLLIADFLDGLLSTYKRTQGNYSLLENVSKYKYNVHGGTFFNPILGRLGWGL